VQGQEGLNVSISINIPSDPTNDDIFFHVSAPAGHAWVGFGFGTQMLDALIFVAYTSQNGKNVTISPRIGLYHEAPQYTHALGVDVLEGSYVDNKVYNINARCTSCRSWPISSGARGKISATSTAQPMLYAIGGDHMPLRTDSLQAKIEQHIAYGRFTIDLQTATGEAGIPDHTTTKTDITYGKATTKSRLLTITHGLIMAICFVVLFPSGALLTRLPLRLAFWLHLICQCSTTVGVLTGAALGLYNSIHNNENPKFNSPHQALGLTITLLLLLQPTLGFRGFLRHRHQRHYASTHNPALAGKLHRYLGPVIILAGVINGTLGLVFANDTGRLPAYVAAFIFVAIVYVVSFWIFLRRTKRNKVVTGVAAGNFRGIGPSSRSVPLKDCAGIGNVSLQSCVSQQSGLSHHSGLSERSLVAVVEEGEAGEEHSTVQFVSVIVIPKDEERGMEC
jgi:hypothetical protein